MNNKYVFLVIAVIVVIAAGGILSTQKKSVTTSAVAGMQKTVVTSPKNTSTMQDTPTTILTTAVSPTDTQQATMYKDGAYDVMGNYQSPGGSEQIDVKITLTKDVISAVSVTPQATRSMSQHFQGLFAANYKSLVVGKKIDAVQLDVVSGSSLTPKGFNDAISQIKQQAKV